MSLNLFTEIDRTTHAYCAARGMATAEMYGTPPNAAEFEASLVASLTKLNAMGAVKGMSGITTPRPVPAPHAVIEYARTSEQMAESERRTDASIQSFFDSCRQRTTLTPFFGD